MKQSKTTTAKTKTRQKTQSSQNKQSQPKTPQQIIYYHDELNDDFAKTAIKTKELPKNYKYINKNIFHRAGSFIFYRLIAPPIAYLYSKAHGRTKFVGRKALKQAKKTGYFIYGNHTQLGNDAFNPNLISLPKRTYIIVGPDAISIKGAQNIVKMLGAIPLPNSLSSTKNFLDCIQKRLNQNNVICIYPEAHIWPYYTKIRNFGSASFAYPVKFDKPTFCFTTTYQHYKNRKKPKCVVYIDGPFYPDKTLKPKEQIQILRDQVYNTMCARAQNSDFEYIKYIKVEANSDKTPQQTTTHTETLIN